MTHFIVTYGLGALFVAVALESAGMPVPGETSLIAAGALASQGYFDIGMVIVIAAMAAIMGDNAGYWAGRWGGRGLLGRSALIRRYAERVLPKAEQFFAHHGGSAVFLARFIAGLRVGAAWMAGMSRMDWRRFLPWNGAGGVVWATSCRARHAVALPLAGRCRGAARRRRGWRHRLVETSAIPTSVASVVALLFDSRRCVGRQLIQERQADTVAKLQGDAAGDVSRELLLTAHLSAPRWATPARRSRSTSRAGV
jgi:membrane protein DedA with SNARE-associated domain